MDEAAPYCFRWRMLAWGIAVLVLVPVLYVAMVGPVWWFEVNHNRNRPWIQSYFHTLAPLDQYPQIDSLLGAYRKWWSDLPPPRSWQRERIVEWIEMLKGELATMQARERDLEKQHTVLVAFYQQRMKELEAETQLRPGRAEELEWIRKELETLSHNDPYGFLRTRSTRLFNQRDLQASEEELRQFDAQ